MCVITFFSSAVLDLAVYVPTHARFVTLAPPRTTAVQALVLDLLAVIMVLAMDESTDIQGTGLSAEKAALLVCPSQETH